MKVWVVHHTTLYGVYSSLEKAETRQTQAVKERGLEGFIDCRVYIWKTTLDMELKNG